MSKNIGDGFELSRRKALAALGTIGAASAGAGLGTSAYFSDEETFTGNTLTAGSLDLKVDWEEHYSDSLEGERAGLNHEVLMEAPTDSNVTYVGLPDPENPLIYVASDDLPTFMENTSIEAYPDADNGGDGDGVQDPLEEYDACEDFADTPEDLNPVTGDRTLNEDTVLNWVDVVEEEAEPDVAPLVNLHDVKPGDFGELTLSFHLCDNPGYVWLQGELVNAAENGHTEPEADSPEEVGGPDTENSTGDHVELVDEIQTLAWYDEDGDNVYEPGGEAGKADVVIVLDRSGSMDGGRLDDAKDAAIDLTNALGSGAQVGVVSFADNVSIDQPLTTSDSDVETAINGLSASGSTNIEGGVDAAHEELTGDDISAAVSASGNHRSDAQPIMVVLSDGQPNVDGDNNDEDHSEWDDADPGDNAEDAKNAGIDVYTVGLGITSGSDTADLLEDMASDPVDSHFFLGPQAELVEIFGQIATSIAGEEAFFRGSLKEFLEAAADGEGIPLDGNRTTAFDELGDDPSDADRECFVNSTNNFVGLAWWVPPEVGNQIQTDSVTFDLGFYTEQCRHNTGAGMSTTAAPPANNSS